MKTPDSNWQPDPQLLAAYFDGELEGRNELADMRARVEAWLEAHPEAAGDWKKHRELQKAWLDTTPAEPSETAWQQTLARIAAGRKAPAAPRRRPWLWIGAAAASIVVLVGAGYGMVRWLTPEPTPLVVQNPPQPAPQPAPPKEEPIEVFEVALASEIIIVRVGGADTETFVVGVPPVVGPLELADAGDVRVLRVAPDANDNTTPNWRDDAPHRPLIWARTD